MLEMALATLLLGGSSASALTLRPPVALTAHRAYHLAAAADTVVVTWTDPGTNQIVVARSVDRGVTFGADEVVEDVRAVIGPRLFYPHDSSAVALSADAGALAVLSAIDLQDTRLPLLYQDRYVTVPVEFFGVGVWRSDQGGAWAPATGVDAMTDRCATPDRGCALLMDALHVALDDAGDLGWVAYTPFDRYLQWPIGANEQLVVAPVERGVVAARPIDLSPLLVPSDRTYDEPTGLATDATGGSVYVSWDRGTNPVTQHLAISHDRGASWSDQALDGNASALGYARDAGVLAWAVIESTPQTFSAVVRTSADDGATFAPPVVVHSTPRGGAGATLMIDQLAFATSRDGGTMAMVYEESVCNPLCGSDPEDVVLEVSQDGGRTWTRLGVLGSTFANTFDVAVASDGTAVYAITSDGAGGTTFVRAD